ncbi:hypothetical protein N9W34_00340 [Rickettsiales bacterium]|nr:hypothetical protein [Rickettsiales bacterium]
MVFLQHSIIRHTTIEKMLKYAVQLNALFIPANSVQSSLSRYTHPPVIHNHNEEIYTCSLRGSSIGIYYRKRYLLLCTRHQLNGCDYKDVGLIDKDGDSLHTSAGSWHYPPSVNETDLNDLIVFDFTAPCNYSPYMKEWFFSLECFPPNSPSNGIIAFIISGYPSQEQKYNLGEEEKHLGFRRESITCLLGSYDDQVKGDPSILCLSYDHNSDFNPDGMSGGAAFVIQLVNGKPRAYLAGMVVRAGNGKFYILRIGFIQKFIDQYLDRL